MPASDDPQIARRLRAARHLAGFKSVEALANALDQRSLGLTTLRGVERGEGTLDPMKRHAIAVACGLPDEFWTMDFHKAAEALEERSELSQLRVELTELREASRRQQADIEVLSAEVRRRNGEGDHAKIDRPQP